MVETLQVSHSSTQESVFRSLCIEVGGTFTDWILFENARIAKTGKVPSTPREPHLGVLRAVEEAGVQAPDLDALVHGSTIATNAVLERKGAATALIVTKGFRDVPFIQRQSKTRLFDLFYRQPEALVPRHRVLEVDERLGPSGEVRQPLNLRDLPERLALLVRDEGVESVAICFLHAYADGSHERLVATSLQHAFPELHITVSHEVLPRFREYDRMSTSLMSAYIRPRIDRYLGRMEDHLKNAGFSGNFSIAQANGGAVPATEARRHAAQMILSGPAAGVTGAIAAAAASGLHNLITFDMGGTSTDVCLVTDGETKMTTDYKVDGLPLAIPIFDIVTVGAGGGSIARVDTAGALRVGPQSAGADPGPACYDRGGTDFTVTDAQVVLGLLPPEAFLGGRMPLNMTRSLEALKPVAKQLGLSDIATADGVLRLANVRMAQAMRLVSIERGHDPRDYAIVAFGGAGPLHAVALADEIGIDTVLVPHNPGLLSAFGLRLAEMRQDYLKTTILNHSRYQPKMLEQIFSDLAAQALKTFLATGLSPEEITFVRSIDLRYEGQAYELTIDVTDLSPTDTSFDVLASRFLTAHRHRYDSAPADQNIEIVNFRLTASHPNDVRSVALPIKSDGIPPEPSEGIVWITDTETPCIFLQRDQLAQGTRLSGAAVILEATSATFVPSGWTATVDEAANLLLNRRDN